jgi:long-chain acyl-CoA synthetase
VSEIVEQFERLRRDHPGRALIHLPAAARSLTADDVWRSSLAQRARLTGLGIGPDHLVISAAGSRPAAISLWLAARAAGAAIMPVDLGTPAAEVGELAARFGATLALFPASACGLESVGVVSAFGDDLVAVAVDGVAPAPEIYGGAAALKVTSGSTGLPKATFTLEAQLVADTASITSAMGIGPDDCQIAVIPLSHAYGLGNLVLPLLLQGTPIVLREAFVPQQLRADAQHYGARVFPGVPFMFSHLAENPGSMAWPRGLDLLISAGAPLDASTSSRFASAFGVRIHSFYGATETGGISFDDAPELNAPSSVGRAMPGVTISLVPEEDAPEGSGRVHVSGPAVASGYAGMPSGDHGFTGSGYLTGDFGRFDDRRRLILTGRASSFINVAGRKVQPDEVEQVLRRMPGIDDVLVLGMADAARGQQVVACVVMRTDAISSTSAIRHYCAARLASHKVPRTIVRLDHIPLTERGKTDRAALERLVRDRTAENGVL